jgi:anaerobic selenocysteine-containing dehydrogenase
MFLEHDDIYQGGGHQHILFGPKVIEPPGECRSNHDVICALAKRLGAEHEGFELSPREIVDSTLVRSGWRPLADLEAWRWIDCQPDFETSHYIDGFAHPDGKFRFAPDWATASQITAVPIDASAMPALPDYWQCLEEATTDMPYRLVTAPARNYLNSTFTETPTSRRREGRPVVLLHPQDAVELGIESGAMVELGNKRGRVRIHSKCFEGLQRKVAVVESLWPNHDFADGIGINALTGADAAAPIGGAAFHDNRVWIRPV